MNIKNYLIIIFLFSTLNMGNAISAPSPQDNLSSLFGMPIKWVSKGKNKNIVPAFLKKHGPKLQASFDPDCLY